MSALRIVYVLRSRRDHSKHYVGLTNDTVGRLNAHNAGKSPHTAKFSPWDLLVALEFASGDVARRFERYLKSGSGRAFAKRHFGSPEFPT